MCFSVHIIHKLEHRCVCVCVRFLCRSCATLSASVHLVGHFELLLSDSYRLDACVVAEASKQHLALCIPLEMVTPEYTH